MLRLALHWQILIGMIVGAVVGLALKFGAGTSSVDVAADKLPAGVDACRIEDSADLSKIAIVFDDGRVIEHTVDATRKTPGSLASLDDLAVKDNMAYRLFQQYGYSWARTIGGLSNRLGMLFLRMLQMVAVPLIVSSLITGVMGLGGAERLGKMFSRTLLYYICTSLLAICTGLLMVNLIRPGLRGERLTAPAAEAAPVSVSPLETAFGQLENMIPSNPIGALAAPNFLSIICFSLAFAIFAVIVGGKTAETVRDFFQAAFEVMMAMTMAVIKLAPLGVLFLMLAVTATQGAAVFQSLGWYMITVICALALHALIVLPLIVKFVAKRSPWQFAKAMSPALLTAFSSAASNGTLPLTLASVETRAGVNNRVSSFVLPLGATINMDGTALYEAVAVLFIAQMHYGVNLSLDQQLIVALTALLASVGAAGIPHAGLVMMVIVLQAVGLPVEMQGIILAVDRVLDMARTSVNVWSDSCGCAVIARFDYDKAQAQLAEQAIEAQPDI